jgi:hypothetical protein
MTSKREKKTKEAEESVEKESTSVQPISTRADLKAFATAVRDSLLKEEAAPIFAMAAMKQILTHDNIYELMDNSIKEILQEIWVKLTQSGLHVRKPPMLFSENDTIAVK